MSSPARRGGKEDQYQVLFEESPVPIFIYDRRTFKIVAVSNAVMESYGYSQAELLALRISDLIPEWEQAKFKAHRHNVVRRRPTGRKRWTGPWHHKRKDGSIVELQVLTSDIVFDGRACRLSYCSDVTEHNLMVAELARAHERAVEASNLKSAFLANMSHELRTPMNGVIGMTGLLLESGLTDQQLSYAEQVARSGAQMLAIINDILDISKLEAGQVELDTTLFDLRDAIADVCAAPRAEAAAKGVAFEIEVAPELPHALRGDARRIQQILLNLVANAVKFTREGTVTVHAAAPIVEPGRVAVELSVADTGIGIEPELLARMFDPFAQAEVSTTRNYGGTGLGLAIVRELVELMGGSVSATSEPGRGSTFTVSLALEVAGTSDRVAGADMNGEPPVPAWPTPPRVLVAEDSAVNQIVAARLLERCGCEVQLACDGREALAALEREQFDAVLMDCQMPLLDGYAATIALREREAGTGRHTPVIAMTAYAMKGDRERCLRVGMDDYISKPLARRELETLIRQWIPASGQLNGDAQAAA